MPINGKRNERKKISEREIFKLDNAIDAVCTNVQFHKKTKATNPITPKSAVGSNDIWWN